MIPNSLEGAMVSLRNNLPRNWAITNQDFYVGNFRTKELCQCGVAHDLKCDPTDLPIRSPHPHRRNRGDGNYHKPIGLLGAEGAPDLWFPLPVLPAVFALILISFRGWESAQDPILNTFDTNWSLWKKSNSKSPLVGSENCRMTKKISKNIRNCPLGNLIHL